MSVTRIASRYAKSLLDLAKEQGNLEAVVEDIRGFNTVAENRDFYMMLKSPIVNATKKAGVFRAIFDGKVNKLTMDFLDIILRKGREFYLPEIAEEFLNQYKDLKNISTIKLTTAHPISDAALEAIKSKLLGSDITKESVEIETTVDADLIGGFIVQVGDKLIDASVAHKLREMAKVIAE